ncbi:MAG: EscU/YscU/HrcU family type III secretion system export apparatus switch protein [Deltaproteobacteria bacterium]|nr:EscU/YscU/HrcU family type III secretion system export apparatus switch protein [Deltaproteobacteria bacterium]
MADDRPGGEPTEPPSEKRLRDARARGEVPRSREAVAAAVFVGVCGLVAATWMQAVATLREFAGAWLERAASFDGPPSAALLDALKAVVLVAGPVVVTAFAAALVASYAQVGALFVLQPVKPQLKRLDPLGNLRRTFGRESLVELLKSTVKLIGTGYLAWTVLWDHAPAIARTVGASPERILEVTAASLRDLALRVGVLVVLMGAFDLWLQRRAYFKRLRMTREEVKREQKESEGDPQHKGERRRLHREILEQRMLERVAKADCVIINPVRIAVAIEYDENSMGAPRVVARGERIVAAKIRAMARKHGVPIVRNVPLARALVDLELDQEIPSELYEAVAEVLRFLQGLGDRESK